MNPASEKRTKSRLYTLGSKVTAEQHDAIAFRARELGISISEYVRLRTLAGPEAQLTVDYLEALMAEVCSLRTIIAYTVANLHAGKRIDAAFMKSLFAEADAMKHEQADLRLAQTRLRSSREPSK